MKYIDVLSKFTQSKESLFDPTPYAIKQSSGLLVSLRKDVQKKYLQNGQFSHTPSKIRDVKTRYLNAAKLKIWVDSGGYDFLKSAKVDLGYMQTYLQYYLHYIQDYHDDFYRIFSLDFQPAIRKDNLWFNTARNIIDLNTRSLSASIDAIKSNDELINKFCFVYHSKTKKLYEIWRNLYSELGLENIVRNRAVGGLVSAYELSRQGTGKNLLFSPVIGPAFNAINDYLKANKSLHDFVLHFLGVSNKLDRFVILLIESIFKKYFKYIGINRKVKFTYDTRTYSTHANVSARTGEIFVFSKNKHDRPIRLPDPTMLSHKRLQDIYFNKVAFNAIKAEMDNIVWDDKLVSTDHYGPLFVWSNRNLDKYFKEFIKSSRLPDILINSKNMETLTERLSKIFDDLVPSVESLKSDSSYLDHKYEQNYRSPLYDIFTSDMVRKIITSCQRIYLFNDWMYNRGCETDYLNNLMLKFIADMGIKDSIS